jgi:hypothetical protein
LYPILEILFFLELIDFEFPLLGRISDGRCLLFKQFALGGRDDAVSLKERDEALHVTLLN